MFRFLDKERTIAGPTYNRWLVPPAALAIHLSIGMAYGFSVFWKPLGELDPTWTQTKVTITFTLFFVLLGSSAAIFGSWLERNGPRKTGVVAALCWGGGFFIAALGIRYRILPLIWLGSGVIGGCGLGLGYISPVSTLIRWFPDRRGMATGMAIMGFGGGALIGMPLAEKLMKHYASGSATGGVLEAFIALGFIYLAAMLCGSFLYRVPAPGWKPHGWTPPDAAKSEMITHRHVHLRNAHKTPQFWLLWGVLCLNVSAGIGVLAVAAPMLQDVFGSKLLGPNVSISSMSTEELNLLLIPFGVGFGGLLSLFNIFGRIFWASLSDKLGRKWTYHIFFFVGIILYLVAAQAALHKNVALFVSMFCAILTMYGGGFATIPAYIADLFGTQFVGAIHGRILTAWSVAAIIGPSLINLVRDHQLKQGVANDAAYNVTLYFLAGLLLLGFICNFLIRPISKKHFMSDEELAIERNRGHEQMKNNSNIETAHGKHTRPSALSWVEVVISWALVGIPLGWGIYMTVLKASKFFVR